MSAQDRVDEIMRVSPATVRIALAGERSVLRELLMDAYRTGLFDGKKDAAFGGFIEGFRTGRDRELKEKTA